MLTFKWFFNQTRLAANLTTENFIKNYPPALVQTQGRRAQTQLAKALEQIELDAHSFFIKKPNYISRVIYLRELLHLINAAGYPSSITKAISGIALGQMITKNKS
jgi:hypothetical protein